MASVLTDRRLHRASVLVAAVLFGEVAWTAPITFNTALPVGTREFVFRGQVVVDASDEDPSGANRERTVLSGVGALGYGVTGRLALFGVLPYVDRELEADGPGGRVTREAAGPGDLSLFARYTMFRRDAPGRTFRIAPFGGVELPTGDDDQHDAFGRVPSPLQSGSGALDVFGGAVATLQTLDYQLDVQAAYRRNGRANGFRRGDEWRLDGSLQYRLWPRDLGSGTPAFLYGVLEAGLKRRGKSESGAADDPNSGGTSFSLTPGIQYVTKRWIVEAGVTVPIVQDLNGVALETDYVVRAGFRVNF